MFLYNAEWLMSWIVFISSLFLSFYKEMHLLIERKILWWSEHCSLHHTIRRSERSFMFVYKAKWYHELDTVHFIILYVIVKRDASSLSLSFWKEMHLLIERKMLWWSEHYSFSHTTRRSKTLFIFLYNAKWLMSWMVFNSSLFLSFWKEMHLLIEGKILWWSEHCSF